MNKIIIFSLLFITIIFFSCNSEYKNKEVDPSVREFQLIDSLTTLFEKGDLKSSREGVKKYVLKNPKSDYGFNFLATIYLAEQEDSLALINIKKALYLNPKNHGALTNYGILLDRREEYEEAYSYYIQAIEIKHSFTQAYSNLMGNRVSLGNLEEALWFGEEAVRYGNNTTDKGLLCAIYHRLGMYDKRDSVYNELKEVNYVNIEKLEELIFEN